MSIFNSRVRKLTTPIWGIVGGAIGTLLVGAFLSVSGWISQGGIVDLLGGLTPENFLTSAPHNIYFYPKIKCSVRTTRIKVPNANNGTTTDDWLLLPKGWNISSEFEKEGKDKKGNNSDNALFSVVVNIDPTSSREGWDVEYRVVVNPNARNGHLETCPDSVAPLQLVAVRANGVIQRIHAK